jgi:hypothetical protein
MYKPAMPRRRETSFRRKRWWKRAGIMNASFPTTERGVQEMGRVRSRCMSVGVEIARVTASNISPRGLAMRDGEKDRLSGTAQLAARRIIFKTGGVRSRI